MMSLTVAKLRRPSDWVGLTHSCKELYKAEICIEALSIRSGFAAEPSVEFGICRKLIPSKDKGGLIMFDGCLVFGLRWAHSSVAFVTIVAIQEHDENSTILHDLQAVSDRIGVAGRRKRRPLGEQCVPSCS